MTLSDLRLVYWTLALVLTGGVVLTALSGWRAIRHGNVDRHRRRMRTAAVLVAIFLASYGVKVLVLGKEDLDTWSRSAVILLWVHETFVGTMVVAGTTALVLSRALRAGIDRADAATRRRHRWAGRIAVLTSVLGLLTAAFVLTGMYLRAS